jgi:hypothetical protein
MRERTGERVENKILTLSLDGRGQGEGEILYKIPLNLPLPKGEAPLKLNTSESPPRKRS